MSFNNTLYDHDAGYYEYVPGMYLPGKFVPDGRMTWSRPAVDQALKVELKDSDVMLATYPKTGKYTCMEGRYLESMKLSK